MADNDKAVIAAAVDTMVINMGQSWDLALNWAALADELIGIIAALGGKVDQVQFAMLLGAAAMARRQSLNAAPEGGA